MKINRIIKFKVLDVPPEDLPNRLNLSIEETVKQNIEKGCRREGKDKDHKFDNCEWCKFTYQQYLALKA